MSEPLVMLPSFRPGLGASASPFVRGCRLVVGFALLLTTLALHVTPARAQNGWLSQDIGTTVGGVTTAMGAELIVAGSGADIWDRRDGFRYVYQSWTGDGTLVVRVDSLSRGDPWAKVGLMFRETLAADARHVSIFATAFYGSGLHRRATVGGETETTPFTGWGTAFPRWLKLVRTGVMFTGYESADGLAWYEVGRADLPGLAASAYLGFAVTSHADGTLITAVLDDIALTGGAPNPAPPTIASYTALRSTQTGTRVEGTMRLIFSEPVTGIDAEDFAVINIGGDLASGAITAVEPVAGNGTTYLIHYAVTYASTSGGRYRINLAASGNGITDTEGAVLVGGATGPALSTAGGPWPVVQARGPAAGIYVTGQDLVIDVDYGVTGMSVNGTPRLSLTLGGNPRSARYSGMAPGSSASTLRFIYTVEAGDVAPDGITLGGVIENGLIIGGNGSLALLSFPPPSGAGVRVNPDSTPGPVTPDASWGSSDIGAVGIAGSSGVQGSTVTLSGAGADIWDTQDAFRFHRRVLMGDGEIVARVASLDRTDPWAKAGLMIRSALVANSPNIFLGINPDYTLVLQHRGSTGAATTLDRLEDRWPPLWLRITRAGDRITTASSPNGTTWTSLGSFTLAADATVFLGLAVTSHRPGTLASATFDQVAFRDAAGPSSPAAPTTPTDLRITARDASRVALQWTDNSTDETHFEVERRADGSYVRIATVGGATAAPTGPVVYEDRTIQPGVSYSYRVRAVSPAGVSGYSSIVGFVVPQPNPWTAARIGGTATGASFAASAQTIRLTSPGGDIWDTADDFYFVHQSLAGDGEIRGRIASFDGADPWAKVGLMIRESTAPGARHVLVYLTPINGVGSHLRTATGGVTQNTPGPWWVSAPYTLRLVRRGSEISAYASADGEVWTLVSTQTLDLPPTALIGLALSPHNRQIVEATFSDVQVTKP